MKIKIPEKCPKCGSLKTGYYIKGNIDPIEKFKKGERVRCFSLYDDYYDNTFCVECRYRWHSEIKTVKVNNQEFQKHLMIHGFYEDRNKYKIKKENEKKRELTEEEKLMIKEQKWENGSRIISWITGLNLKGKNPYTLKRIKNEVENEDINLK